MVPKKKNIKFEDIEKINFNDLWFSSVLRNNLRSCGTYSAVDLLLCDEQELRAKHFQYTGTEETETYIKEIKQGIENLKIDGLHLGMNYLELITFGMNEIERKEYVTTHLKEILHCDVENLGLPYATVLELENEQIYNLLEILISLDPSSSINYSVEADNDIKKMIVLMNIPGVYYGMEASKIDLLDKSKDNEDFKQIEWLKERNNSIKKENEHLKNRLTELKELLSEYSKLKEETEVLIRDINYTIQQLEINEGQEEKPVQKRKK